MHSRAGLTALIVGLAGVNLLILGLLVLGLIVFMDTTRPGPAGGGPVLGRSYGGAMQGSAAPVATAPGALPLNSGTNPAAYSARPWFNKNWLDAFWPVRPAIGGIYTCSTCRGYPSGAHYSRDSWRWQD